MQNIMVDNRQLSSLRLDNAASAEVHCQIECNLFKGLNRTVVSEGSMQERRANCLANSRGRVVEFKQSEPAVTDASVSYFN